LDDLVRLLLENRTQVFLGSLRSKEIQVWCLAVVKRLFYKLGLAAAPPSGHHGKLCAFTGPLADFRKLSQFVLPSAEIHDDNSLL
jgi:hypothetical protein